MAANSFADCSDNAFGPASCTRDFDFTLTFEQSILSILPSALLLLITPLRLFQLSRRRSKTVPHRNYALKPLALVILEFVPCDQYSSE
ncbi:hypothetical protein VTN77DRAFT_3707 [Rasamsonia byssochlamydoides]|uniref:uncharacterized protein n=1 Tax=Rasamsonia byssochlamydoides TaxID=89139 RepID=UPI003743E29D